MRYKTAGLLLGTAFTFVSSTVAEGEARLPWDPFARAREQHWAAYVGSHTRHPRVGSRDHRRAIFTQRVHAVGAQEIQLSMALGCQPDSEQARSVPLRETSTVVPALLGVHQERGETQTIVSVQDEARTIAGREFRCKRAHLCSRGASVVTNTLVWLSEDVRATSVVALRRTVGAGETEVVLDDVRLIGFGEGKRVSWGLTPSDVDLRRWADRGEVQARREPWVRKAVSPCTELRCERCRGSGETTDMSSCLVCSRSIHSGTHRLCEPCALELGRCVFCERESSQRR
jgi:hypothetical protein